MLESLEERPPSAGGSPDLHFMLSLENKRTHAQGSLGCLCASRPGNASPLCLLGEQLQSKACSRVHATIMTSQATFVLPDLQVRQGAPHLVYLGIRLHQGTLF